MQIGAVIQKKLISVEILGVFLMLAPAQAAQAAVWDTLLSLINWFRYSSTAN
ncbi:hypothetical protein [Desulfosporosinus sp.]|uniref:hypothetical protein n=1 Tax=Desulfosporosinus sp. TaxID=157907 RepID=UPI00231558B4|nr:hypothetical protein [Desulfosporosinus sp.]MCO5384566.1 hypothetical protein [Desulfosporosinus sp.]MDA8220255.1 hypothetical protein [Desulfitobacterium hafniense]